MRALGRVVVALGVLTAGGGLTACIAGDLDGLPPYCATRGGDDETFWRLVEGSCRVATDGDRAQGRALRAELAELPPEQVADFHRTLVRMNRALYTRSFTQVADDACLPGLGLGDDLGTDFRSWVVAHGQEAYEAVLADPSVVTRFPDLASGCGSGELFGFAASNEYDRLTGRSGLDDGLPSIDPDGAPMMDG